MRQVGLDCFRKPKTDGCCGVGSVHQPTKSITTKQTITHTHTKSCLVDCSVCLALCPDKPTDSQPIAIKKARGASQLLRIGSANPDPDGILFLPHHTHTATTRRTFGVAVWSVLLCVHLLVASFLFSIDTRQSLVVQAVVTCRIEIIADMVGHNLLEKGSVLVDDSSKVSGLASEVRGSILANSFWKYFGLFSIPLSVHLCVWGIGAFWFPVQSHRTAPVKQQQKRH